MATAKKRSAVIFYLNGERQEVSGRESGMMLADWLRYQRGLTGTKIVCAEGDCGACSVLRRFPHNEDRFQAINSCIITVAQMDGSSLVTVDAIKDGEKLSPVQDAMMKCHGSQCGFCTPGFVVALTDLVEKKLKAESSGQLLAKDAKNATTGNLCRCTGYKPIIEAAESISLATCESVEDRYFSHAQDKELKKVFAQSLEIQSDEFSFFAPKTLREASAYLRKHPEARIIAAGTDLGVFHNKWKKRYEKLLSLHLIAELYDLKIAKGKTVIGARVTLSELRHGMQKNLPELSQFLDLFASPQIKNVATLIGNVANASPIGDTPAMLLAADAAVEIYTGHKKKMIPLCEFYLGYRKLNLKKGEIITAIHLPQLKNSQRLSLYKSSQRKDLDISIVNFGAYVEDDKSGHVALARFAIGGVAATPLRLYKTEQFLLGKKVTEDVLAKAAEILQSEITPISDLRSDNQFRRVIAENFFFKYFREQGLLPENAVRQLYLAEANV